MIRRGDRGRLLRCVVFSISLPELFYFHAHSLLMHHCFRFYDHSLLAVQLFYYLTQYCYHSHSHLKQQQQQQQMWHYPPVEPAGSHVQMMNDIVMNAERHEMQ